MNKTAFLKSFLDSYQQKKRLRTLKNFDFVSANQAIIDGQKFINFSSNDYLGLSHNIEPQDQLNEINYGTGATSSRLVCGNISLNQELEDKISQWKGSENCLILNSGYQANTGIIPAITDRHTLIFSDKLNHASIIDGIKLSGAQHLRYQHNDLNKLRELLSKYKESKQRKIIISETLFSMDGDYSDIDALKKLSQEFNTLLYIDDAHGSGISGENGIGPCEGNFKDIDIYIGTFGKAHGSFGAYCCCSTEMKSYLINTTRTLIFSTGLPPSLLLANSKSVDLVINANKERQSLNENISFVQNFLEKSPFQSLHFGSPIIPIIIGSDEKALALSEHLYANQILATAIRPPTIPEGTARIRLTITASHTEEDLENLKTSLLKWQDYAS